MPPSHQLEAGGRYLLMALNYVYNFIYILISTQSKNDQAHEEVRQSDRKPE